MITIVIADDEKLIRAGLKKILLDSLDIELNIIEAKNGEEALDICKKEHPELILTDIRMPKMDGVELMKNLSSFSDSPAIIVLSGFDDFAYAKAAIQSGAASYLLKPVDKKELLNSVKEAIQSYQKEEKQRNEEILKSFILDNNLSGKGFVTNKFNDGFYCVSIYGDSVLNLIESVPSFYKCYCVENRKKYNCFVIQKKDFEIINDESFSKCIIGVSSLGKTISDLKRIKQESFIAILKSFFTTSLEKTANVKANDIYTFNPEAKVLDFSIIDNMYDKLIASFDVSKIDDMQKRINILFTFSDDIDVNAEYLNYIYLKICNDLFIRYQNFITNDTYLLLKQMMIMDILQANTIIEWQSYLCDFSIYLSNIMKQNETTYPYIVEAVEYTKKHFTKKINMAIVANYVSTNYTWFSEKFKEQMGINFNDYLKKLRIEEAKKLLELGCYKVYEVSDRSGFKDVKYFMKSFRENTGMSPTEWKNKYSN